MEIILQEDFPQLGYVGDRFKVKAGFARNFLIPRGIAVAASSRQGDVIKHKVSIINLKKTRLKKVAEELAERLQAVSLEFVLKAGAGGKTFGSVTSRDIEAELLKKGFELDRKQIRLVESLKVAGEHKVEIKLHSEVVASVSIVIIAEKSAARSASKRVASEDQPSEDSSFDAVESGNNEFESTEE